jgi:hypothetical protein
MIVAGKYSFNGGFEFISKKYSRLLNEIREIIAIVDAEQRKTKQSKEKTMPGRELYSPISLNTAFKAEFSRKGWLKVKVHCEYPINYYTEAYEPKKMKGGAFREMDFVKKKLGVEVQFGKYAFMIYNVCAKMTIFSKMKFIEAGVEIVPIKQFADNMSTGVSYFEQLVWDLEKRGVSNIDIPVLILGVDI